MKTIYLANPYGFAPSWKHLLKELEAKIQPLGFPILTVEDVWPEET